jgi:DHA1 family bicyclomycin/chloramphenicol resistance-like MFS transporter
MGSLSRIRSLSPSRRTAPSFAALVLVSGIGPLALDTYMPAMPQMRASFDTTAAVIQLTVTGYLIGLAVGQLLAGPVSDGIGRRPLLLWPAVVFTVAAVFCATATNPDVLVVTRVIHGIAAGATIACGRAVIGDRYRGGELATRFGTLTAITQVGPVIAPGLGSLIMTLGNWRTIFWGMALLGVVMVAWIALGVPETLPPARRDGTGIAATARRTSDLIRDWDFSRHVVIQCLLTFGFFIYIGGASFVLQTVYGISGSEFSLIFAVNATMIMLGMIAYRLTVLRFGPGRLRNAGVAGATTAAFALLAATRLGHQAPPLAVTWLLLAVVTASMGLVLPASMTLAQEAGKHVQGTASSLQGGLAMLAGALATPMTGLFGDSSLLPMAALMTAGFTAGAVVLVVASRLDASRLGAGHRSLAADELWPAPEPVQAEPPEGIGGLRIR